MKADLHMHGPIGFQSYWLNAQGYEKSRLLQTFIDYIIKAGLDICAITNDEDEIPRNSIHDRLGYLAGQISTLPKNYKADKIGENAIIAEKDSRRIYLINGQTVRVLDNGRRIDHLLLVLTKFLI